MVLKLVVSVVIVVVVWRIGFAMLKGLARPLPEPLPAGEMRKVNLRYRCGICGAELKMVLAADELPEPPRHCQDDMDLVAPPLE